MMIVDNTILDELTAKAKASPRLRMNMDLRNSEADQSRRMLNALAPGRVMHIHRHKGSSETCICIRVFPLNKLTRNHIMKFLLRNVILADSISFIDDTKGVICRRSADGRSHYGLVWKVLRET